MKTASKRRREEKECERKMEKKTKRNLSSQCKINEIILRPLSSLFLKHRFYMSSILSTNNRKFKKDHSMSGHRFTRIQNSKWPPVHARKLIENKLQARCFVQSGVTSASSLLFPIFHDHSVKWMCVHILWVGPSARW